VKIRLVTDLTIDASAGGAFMPHVDECGAVDDGVVEQRNGGRVSAAGEAK
jgi:hypothetical protein